MTSAEPAPVFRRFPWMQLVFCIACLAMAAWTWMRYSYCYHTTVAELNGASFSEAPSAWHGYYVQLSGRLWHGYNDLSWRIVEDRDQLKQRVWAIFDDAGKPQDCEPGSWIGGRGVWVGRASIDELSQPRTSIHVSASRFTGASVAGLVVGAMGCFIFGLYLRRWLGESKALAGEPQQDMIA